MLMRTPSSAAVAVDDERAEVGKSMMHVQLNPGARLQLSVQRFINQPTVAFSWPT